MEKEKKEETKKEEAKEKKDVKEETDKALKKITKPEKGPSEMKDPDTWDADIFCKRKSKKAQRTWIYLFYFFCFLPA